MRLNPSALFKVETIRHSKDLIQNTEIYISLRNIYHNDVKI